MYVYDSLIEAKIDSFYTILRLFSNKLGVALAVNDVISCDGGGGSLVRYVNIGVWLGVGTGGHECNREGVCTNDT